MNFVLPDLLPVANRHDDAKDVDAALSAVKVVTLRHVVALCRTYVTQKQKITEIRKEISDLCSNGAGTRSRTRDLLITSQLLYQLSYTGVMGCEYIASDALVKPSCLIQLKKIDHWRFWWDADG